jgi:hypothetical protein
MLIRLAVMIVFVLSAREADSATRAASPTPCAATDSQTLETLHLVKKIASSPNPVPVEERTALAIPNVPESDVVIVTTESICTAALAAINRDLGTPGQTRSINIIRAGTVFLVHEIGERVGEWDLWFKYDDSTFSELKDRLGL